MLFFRSNFFKGSETDLNKLVQKQLALNSTRVTLESSQANLDRDKKRVKVYKMVMLFYHNFDQNYGRTGDFEDD